jgi:hypothetical protein
MANKNLNRYDPANLNLSAKTREGIANGSLIDVIKAIAVQLKMQDEVYEDTFADIKNLLNDHETRIGSLEKRVDELEKKIA